MAWRDSRTQRQRLAIFSLAIVSGIAALVAIHSLKASVQTGIDRQAKALLGSDMEISSRKPVPPDAEARIAARATSVSRETSFASMLYFPTADAARVVQVRGIEGGYPYYGKIETIPADAWSRLHAESGILLEPAMLDQFNARVGDKVKLGSLELPILGVVKKAPPRNAGFIAFSPDAFVRLEDLPRTGLLGPASLATHHLHFKFPAGADLKKTKRWIREKFPDSALRIETPDDRRKSLGDALDNFQQFLGIVALAALVLGAIGVAGAVHAHVSRRVPAVAILRCLGCPGDLAFAIYFAQAIALGVVGALIGGMIGIALHTGVIIFFRASLPIEVDPSPEWRVAMETTAAGLAVCCGFALLPLLRVRRISPAATLRDGAALGGGSSALRLWPIYAMLAGLLIVLASVNASDWKRALGMVAGLGVAFAILAAVAKGLVLAAKRVVRPSWPYLPRQGISNLHRPHNQTLLFLLSLGLGTFLLLTIVSTRNLLTQRLTLTQLADSPNIYLIDVQPDQLEGVKTLIRSQKLPVMETAPIVTMRIQSVRGVPVRKLEKEGRIPKWVLQREYRSSYHDRLTSTETLVAGQWFPKTIAPNDAASANPRSSISNPQSSPSEAKPGATPPDNPQSAIPNPQSPVPLSLEDEIAADLHVSLGDEIVLDVQGVPVHARVTSLRKIDWSRFNLNFFMVFPPGVLEGAPGFDVVTTRIPPGRSSGELQRLLVHQFPNVSAIDLTLILDTVRGILEKIARVISILAGFSVLAGLPILAGALLNGRDQRLRESVLLRTLGASSRQVRAILVIEYVTLGALSAFAGVILSIVANWALAIFVFKANPWPDPLVLCGAFAIPTILALVSGLTLGRGVCRHPPLEILRAVA
jgi:putative ABC transport system permease protein